jgi:precorrin-6B methylase 2
MSSEKRDFDKEAAAWDEQPARVQLAGDVAAAIVRQVTLRTDMDVLDFGCGTGLLTLQWRCGSGRSPAWIARGGC